MPPISQSNIFTTCTGGIAGSITVAVVVAVMCMASSAEEVRWRVCLDNRSMTASGVGAAE